MPASIEAEMPIADQSITPCLLSHRWGRIDKITLTGVLILAVLAIFGRSAVAPTKEETLEHFWSTLP